MVTPIQKSKDNFELTNFRPISVLPVLSKVLERIAHDQLVSHLLKFNLSDKTVWFSSATFNSGCFGACY